MRLTNILLLTVFFVAALAQQKPIQPKLRLIAFNETHTEWLTAAAIEQLGVDKVKFMDITDNQNPQISAVAPDPLPDQPQYKMYPLNINTV